MIGGGGSRYVGPLYRGPERGGAMLAEPAEDGKTPKDRLLDRIALNFGGFEGVISAEKHLERGRIIVRRDAVDPNSYAASAFFIRDGMSYSLRVGKLLPQDEGDIFAVITLNYTDGSRLQDIFHDSDAYPVVNDSLDYLFSPSNEAQDGQASLPEVTDVPNG